MTQPSNLADLKALAAKKDKLKGINKEVIEAILLQDDVQAADGQADMTVGEMYKNLSSQISEIKTVNETALQRVTVLEGQVNELKADQQKCWDIISNQQRFLEKIDAEKREKNIIIYGVDERQNEVGNTDEEKVTRIMNTIGQADAETTAVKRLGKANEGHKRPLLVSFGDKAIRQSVLEKAKVLKDKGDTYKMMYIKKDMHPAVKRELDRLYKAFRQEKEKPDNTGKNVEFDRQNRTISCDGVVIDRFKPVSFF